MQLPDENSCNARPQPWRLSSCKSDSQLPKLHFFTLPQVR